MDDQNSQNIDSYIKNLPQKVQDFVFDREWQDRVYEISKKYSLNEDQSENLADIVVLVLIGLQNPETFLDSIVKDLGVSRLLAEQIMEDIDKRVFDFAMKSVGSLENNPPKSPSKENVPFIKPLVPEIKPENLPMDSGNPVEKHDILKTQADLSNTQPKKPEEVQKPLSVPRFTAVPIENEEVPSESPETKKPEDMMSDKLKSVTTSSAPKPETPKNYAVDPYREPIE